MNYYKISPEWAQKLNVKDTAVEHPDGWFLILPTYAMPLLEMLDPDEYGELNSIEEAVVAVGGCVYTKQQALLSQKGDPEYMMNVETDIQEPEHIQEEPEHDQDPEQEQEQEQEGKED